MGSMFSSPGKQAQQAAAASGALSQGEIASLQQYDQQQRDALRGAIQGMGQNPYFAAASEMNPGNYAINPADTTSFGSQGPGTQTQAVTPANPAVPYDLAAALQRVPVPPPPTANPVTAPPPPSQINPGKTGKNPPPEFGRPRTGPGGSDITRPQPL